MSIINTTAEQLSCLHKTTHILFPVKKGCVTFISITSYATKKIDLRRAIYLFHTCLFFSEHKAYTWNMNFLSSAQFLQTSNYTLLALQSLISLFTNR